MYDILAIPCAWILAYWLRFNMSEIPEDIIVKAFLPAGILVIVQTASYYMFKVYRGIWRYSSISDVINIIKSISAAVLLTIAVLLFSDYLQFIPRSIWPIYSILSLLFLCGGRLCLRWYKESSVQKISTNAKRTVIIGAGRAGESLLRNILQDNAEYHVIGLMDDNQSYLGLEIHGVKVLGNIDQLVKVCELYKVEFILLAIPTATSKEMRRIVTQCEKSNIPFRTLPTILDIASGKIDIKTLREVRIEDLLGRDQVNLDWEGIAQYIKNKKVMVTGGGGSIGSELCRQISKLNPAELLILDNSEYNLYKIQMELAESCDPSKLKIFLNSVTNAVVVDKIIQQNQPNVIFHAAAYKHVPLLEGQADCAILNNIIGTKIVANTAVKYSVEKFVLISTDKAVNPTNIMGATKRIAEIFCQNLNYTGRTQFITVRFGNVLGSTGSVVPLFQEQLNKGGPLTVTHPEIERYFMTIPEASRLILQAMLNGNGGEIFVLDMGEPIKIRYLAEQMIKLSGKQPYRDIQITYTGLRPGEKLFEELFYDREKLESTSHEKILMAKCHSIQWEEFKLLISYLENNIYNFNNQELQHIVKQLLPEYNISIFDAQTGAPKEHEVMVD